MPINPSLFDSPDHLGLVRAVCEDPADDLPRHAYADWCDENGFARRATFIRASIRLERENWTCPGFMYSCGENIDTLEKLALLGCPRCREYAVLKMEVEAMATTFTTAAGDVRFTFARGFADSVEMTSHRFVDDAADLFACQPIVSVRLTDVRPYVFVQMTSPSPNNYMFASGGAQWFRRGDEHPALNAGERPFVPAKLIDDDDDWRTHFAGVFLSAEKANAALSFACVRYGRRLAGLRTLTTPEPKEQS